MPILNVREGLIWNRAVLLIRFDFYRRRGKIRLSACLHLTTCPRLHTKKSCSCPKRQDCLVPVLTCEQLLFWVNCAEISMMMMTMMSFLETMDPLARHAHVSCEKNFPEFRSVASACPAMRKTSQGADPEFGCQGRELCVSASSFRSTRSLSRDAINSDQWAITHGGNFRFLQPKPMEPSLFFKLSLSKDLGRHCLT